MVENKPEHDHVPAEPEHREDVAREDAAAAEPVADEAPVAEDASVTQAHEQPYDIAAEERQERTEASDLPEPDFATTTAEADAPVRHHLPAQPWVEPPRRSPGMAAMLLSPILTIAIATALVVGAAKTGLLPEFLSTTSITQPSGDTTALDDIRARLAKLEARPDVTAAPSSDSSAALQALAARVASLEARPAQAAAPSSDSAAPDQAGGDASDLAGRVDALGKDLTAAREQIAALQARQADLDGAVKDVKAQPATPDSTAAVAKLDQRVGEIEQAAKAEAAAPKPELASQAALNALEQRLGETDQAVGALKTAPPPIADDTALRKLVAATLLDISVHQGEPYAELLKAAKPLAADASGMDALDAFAATGIPTQRALGQQLLPLLPKLLPAKGTGDDASFVDRVQNKAENLLKFQRTDAVQGPDRAAIISRLTADAKAGETAAAIRELKALAPGDRAPVQSWIDTAEARDRALAASNQFAISALSALQTTSR